MTHPEKIRLMFLARLIKAGVTHLDYYEHDKATRRVYVQIFRSFVYDTPHLDAGWLGEILGIHQKTASHWMQRIDIETL